MAQAKFTRRPLASTIRLFPFLKKNQIAMVVGIVVLNFIGGLMMVIELPGSPLWFDLTDLIFAYAPMGYLGWVLAGRKNNFVTSR